jgi:hypothetical protein
MIGTYLPTKWFQACLGYLAGDGRRRRRRRRRMRSKWSSAVRIC